MRQEWRHRRYQKTAINVSRKMMGQFDEVIHLPNVAEMTEPLSENGPRQTKATSRMLALCPFMVTDGHL